jgi:hypothetical protein
MGKIKIDLELLRQNVKITEPATKELFAKLKKKQPKQLDSIVHAIHDEVFEELDCLECANC